LKSLLSQSDGWNEEILLEGLHQERHQDERWQAGEQLRQKGV
jgi:hypothetical protein